MSDDPTLRHRQHGLPPLYPGELFVGRETDKDGESSVQAVVALPPGADDDVLTVVEGAPAWAAPSSPSGGSSAPTDVLLFGTDIPLAGTWTVADLENWGDYPARIFKLGGWVGLSGVFVKGSGTSALITAQIPADYVPAWFGEAPDTNPTRRFPGISGNGVATRTEVGLQSTVTGLVYFSARYLDGTPMAEGDVLVVDSISWPLDG